MTGFRWLKNAYVLTAGAGFGLFAFSFVVLGLWPNRTLSDQIARTDPAGRTARTASEDRGRHVYSQEGCMNCHSQLVRFTEDDVRRSGPASEAWESGGDAPQMWGTRRVGPDLAREGGRKSRDWQLANSLEPRHVVPDSVMPGYPWLFDGARRSRGGRESTSSTTWSRSAATRGWWACLGRGNSPAAKWKKRGERECSAIAISPGPPEAPVWNSTSAIGEAERFARRGADVFARNCAGCHGKDGLGDGPAAVALTPVPRNLSTAQFSHRSLSESLWNGVRGSSMPSWSDLPSRDLMGLVAYLKTIAPKEQPPDLTAQSGRQGRPSSSNNVRSATARTGTGTVLPRRSWLPPRPTSTRSGRRCPSPYGLDEWDPGHRDAEMGAETHARRALVIGSIRPVVLREGARGVT